MNFVAWLILIFIASLIVEGILVVLLLARGQLTAARLASGAANILRSGLLLVWCAAVVKLVWGTIWMWVGLILGLAPIFPMALIATALKGAWLFWAEFWAAAIIIGLTRALSFWLFGLWEEKMRADAARNSGPGLASQHRLDQGISPEEKGSGNSGP